MNPAKSGYCKCGQANTATNPGDVVYNATFAPEELSSTAHLVVFGSAKCKAPPQPAMVEVKISQNGSPWQSIGFLSAFGTGRVALKPLSAAPAIDPNGALDVQLVLGADTETDADKDFFGVSVLELDA